MRSVSLPLILGIVLCGIAPVACSAFDEAPSTPAPSSSDGGVDSAVVAVDAAAPPPEGGRIDSGAPPQVVATEDFDTSCAFNGFDATATHSPGDGREGSGACRVCAAVAKSDYDLDTGGAFASLPPGRYRVSAWVKKYGTTAYPDYRAIVARRLEDPTDRKEAADEGQTNAEIWTKLEVEYELKKGHLNLTIGGFGDALQTCLLVDDLEIALLR